MKKPTAIALVAIGALFAGAIALLDRLTEEPAAPVAGLPPAPEPPPPTPAAASPTPPPIAAAAAPGPEASPPLVPPGPPAPGRAGVDLLTSLGAARAEVLDCAGVTMVEPEQGRRAAQATRRGASPWARATLSLDLEPQEGQMLVREARLLASEGTNEDLGRCAVEVLSGRTLPAFGARPGALLKMKFVVEEPGR